MLKELHEMTTRIEKLSKSEHDLISEVHPQVSEIRSTSRTFGMPFRPKRADAGDSGLAELRTSG